MFKHLNCLIGRTNIDNFIIVKFGNYKVDLKENFANNWQNSNALQFRFKMVYEVRPSKNHFRRQILSKSPCKKQRYCFNNWKKLERSPIFKFPSLKMIWSLVFKNNLWRLYKTSIMVQFGLKNGVNVNFPNLNFIIVFHFKLMGGWQ